MEKTQIFGKRTPSYKITANTIELFKSIDLELQKLPIDILCKINSVKKIDNKIYCHCFTYLADNLITYVDMSIDKILISNEDIHITSGMLVFVFRKKVNQNFEFIAKQ